jgi:broad specificity phosphatase PhoE
MEQNGTTPLERAMDQARRHGDVVLLVRHARTADNAAKVLVGRRDVPLDRVGLAQAGLLRAQLRRLAPASLVCSPLLRARQTLEGLGPVQLEPRLVEVHHGDIEGLQEREFQRRFGDFIQRWQRDPEHTPIPGGGESLGEAAQRALPALDQLVRSLPGPVVVCSHQLIIATLLCHCRGLALTHYRDHTCRNTAINVLSHEDGRWRVHLMDHVDHLDSVELAALAQALDHP